MALYLGSQSVTDLKMGSQNVQRLYKGSTLLWGRITEPPQAAVQATDFTGGLADWDWRFTTGIKSLVAGGSIGGSVLEFASNGSGVIVWSLVNQADVEILAKIQQSSGAGTRAIGVSCRVGGPDSAREGYSLHFSFGSAGSLTIGKFSGTSSIQITTAHSTYPILAAFTRTATTYYWYRFRVVGNVMLGKVWPSGSAEPADWMAGVTDSSYAAAGITGMYRPSNFDTHQADYFAVGDGSSTIPVPT